MSEAKDDRNGSALPAIGLICIAAIAVAGVMAASEDKPEPDIRSREILAEMDRVQRMADNKLSRADTLTSRQEARLMARKNLADLIIERHGEKDLQNPAVRGDDGNQQR